MRTRIVVAGSRQSEAPQPPSRWLLAKDAVRIVWFANQDRLWVPILGIAAILLAAIYVVR